MSARTRASADAWAGAAGASHPSGASIASCAWWVFAAGLAADAAPQPATPCIPPVAAGAPRAGAPAPACPPAGIIHAVDAPWRGEGAYTGAWRLGADGFGVPHGDGSIVYDDGARFDGTFRDGVRCRGYYHAADGLRERQSFDAHGVCIARTVEHQPYGAFG